MKLKSTLLYGASGSFEEVTVKKWKKLRVMAHKASGNFTNISQRYRDQQTAMAATVALFKKIAAIVYVGWKQSKSYPGEYAAFVGYTLKNAWDFTTPGSPVLNSEDIVVAKGSMPITPITSSSSDQSSNNIIVNWATSAGYGQASTDKIQLAVYNKTTDTWLYDTTGAARSVGTRTITPPAGFLTAADELEAHTFFYGLTETDTANTASDDVMVPITVVA